MVIYHIAVFAAIDHPKGTYCIFQLDGIEKCRQSYIVELIFDFFGEHNHAKDSDKAYISLQNSCFHSHYFSPWFCSSFTSSSFRLPFSLILVSKFSSPILHSILFSSPAILATAILPLLPWFKAVEDNFFDVFAILL